MTDADALMGLQKESTPSFTYEGCFFNHGNESIRCYRPKELDTDALEGEQKCAWNFVYKMEMPND